MIGRIVATKLNKTVTVLEESEKLHPLYKKGFMRSKKYLADDPLGVKMGDLVEIVKVAPISKRKHFRVTKVVGKSLAEITEEKLKEEAKGVIEEVMPEEKGEGETVKGEEVEIEKAKKEVTKKVKGKESKQEDKG